MIKSKLKPTVIRFLGQPHESAIQLQTTLFPTVKVIRFIEDPLSSNLDQVFVPGYAEEKALALIKRRFSKYGDGRCSDYGQSHYHYNRPAVQPLKIVEYQKKGVEHHDLKCLDVNRIQSSVEARTWRDECFFYLEDWENYEPQQSSRNITQYMVRCTDIPMNRKLDR